MWRTALAACILMVSLPVPGASRAQVAKSLEDGALAAWRDFDYATAETLYRKALSKDPSSPEANAGLVRTLLDEKKLSDAETADAAAMRAAPNSAPVQAADGDLLFREGLIEQAEAGYRNALKFDERYARGWYGLSQIAQANSYYRTAKNSILKAHDLDPADPEIYEAWASRLPRAERLRAIEHMVDHHGHLDAERLSILQSRLAWLMVLGNSTAWRMTSTVESAKIKLETVRAPDHSPLGTRTSAVAVKVQFNDRKTATLLLDTGAAGIVVHRGFAAKAGLKQVFDIATHGIGDQKAANGYLAWANSVKIGPITWENVPVHALEGNFAEGTDGLIGIDVFEHFLIALDIGNRELDLAPLPPVPDDHRDADGATDRYIAPEMKSFEPVLHMGAHILVPTSIEGRPDGLFFVDTGAFDTQVDPKYIPKNKLAIAPNLTVRGLSGDVKNVYLAKDVRIQFGRFVQDNFQLVAISMDKLSDGEGIALSGILGFPLLSQFRLVIDYRDGLVDFEYKHAKGT